MESFLVNSLSSLCDRETTNPQHHQPFRSGDWTVVTSPQIMAAVKGKSGVKEIPKQSYLVEILLSCVPNTEAMQLEPKIMREKLTAHTELFVKFPTHQENTFSREIVLKLVNLIPFPRITLWDASLSVGIPTLGFESPAKDFRGFVAGVTGQPEGTFVWPQASLMDMMAEMS